MIGIVENSVGGLIASEAHGVIRMVLFRINAEVHLARGLKKELDDLQGQLTKLYWLLEGASGQPITNQLMVDWLKKTRCAAYDVDYLLDEWSYELLKQQIRMVCRKKKLKKVLSHLFCRLRMGHRVRDLRTLIGNIYNDAKELGIKPIKVAAGDVYSIDPPSSASKLCDNILRRCVGDEFLLGRDDDILHLVKLLCDPCNSKRDLTVVGIVGLAGLGKTSLSKRVSKVQEVTKIFNSLILWLVVSHSFDLIDILNRTVEILFGTTSNMRDKQALLLKLQKKLKGRRYLLILDDVWDTIDWESLRSTLHEIGGSRGTVLLVTSRNKNVVAKMETWWYDFEGNMIRMSPIIHLLRGLSEKDSWSLFAARIRDDTLVCNEKELIARRMMKNCGGVPLAIRALGDLLRDKSTRRWKEIESSDTWAKEDEYGILPSLKLSYNYLPNMALKKCFAYCAIFGEDEVIEKDKLICMWMAQGFLQPFDQMELVGEEYLKYLLSSSLFQEANMDEFGNVKTIKMHDLVWSLASLVSMGECLFLNRYKSNGSSEVRHLSIPQYYERELSFTSYSNLQTCLHNENFVHRSLIFMLKCSHLKVLCLGRIWDKNLEWELLGRLKHLRFFEIIVDNDLDVMRPSLRGQIPKLYHLQTLWIKSTNLHFVITGSCVPFFPKDIGNLVNLRHIRVDGGSIGIPAGLGQLTDLRTLPIINLKENWGGRLSELGLLSNLTGTLEIHNVDCIKRESAAESLLLGDKLNLEQLVLKWNSSFGGQTYQTEVLESLKPHSNLEMLQVCGYDGMRFPRWLIESGSVLYNLVTLRLFDCEYAVGELKLDNFRYLRFLSVYHCKELSISFPDHGSKSLKLLERLEVFDCYIAGSLPVLAPLTRLCVLEIRRCSRRNTRTTNKCELEGLASLPCLRDLCTDELLPVDLGEGSPVCKSLEKLTLEESDDNKVAGTLPEQLKHLMALRYLKIRCFESIELLENWLGNLTSLQGIELVSMAKLKYLPSKHAMQGLSNLNTFSVAGCPFLSEDFKYQGGEWFKIAHIPYIEVDFTQLS